MHGNYVPCSKVERELTHCPISYFHRRLARNPCLILAVHLAQGIRYQPFPGFADFDVHEVIAGPLNAGLFPRLDLDSTFGPERLFVYTPQSESLFTVLYLKLHSLSMRSPCMCVV